MIDTPIIITTFADKHAKAKRPIRCTPRELAEEIRLTTADKKDELPWLKLAKFGNAKSSNGSLRHDKNVVSVCGVECDYDGARLPVSHAVSLLEQRGLASIVYSSPSHREDKPRWRVLAFTSAEMEPTRRKHMAGRLNGLFRGVFARESFTLSQAYFFGSVRRNPSHEVHLVEGGAIDADDDLDGVWTGPPEQAGRGAGADPEAALADSELVRQVITGESFHVALCALAGRYVGRGICPDAVEEIARGMMLAHPPESRDQRWSDRFAEIGALVASAARKFKPSADQRKALARLTGRLIRARKSEAEILAAVAEEADRLGVAGEVAERIAQWVAGQEVARRRGHA